MCASLAGVLLAIEHLNHAQVSLEPFSEAQAVPNTEGGIRARVVRESAALPSKSAAETKPIDKTPASH